MWETTRACVCGWLYSCVWVFLSHVYVCVYVRACTLALWNSLLCDYIVFDVMLFARTQIVFTQHILTHRRHRNVLPVVEMGQALAEKGNIACACVCACLEYEIRSVSSSVCLYLSCSAICCVWPVSSTKNDAIAFNAWAVPKYHARCLRERRNKERGGGGGGGGG